MCFITYNISGDKSKELVKLFEVEYYEKSDGTYPAEEFILSQDIKMQTKIFRLLELLELKGNELREPYSKSLSDGIFEIRAIQGNNISRVLYFFVVGKKIILTNGFVKKTQKTPDSEITLAKKYRTDYELRKGNL
ncbi:MAG: type II toxin-antitoxin system RelE/ParE family toxin [Ruminococcus sp.]